MRGPLLLLAATACASPATTPCEEEGPPGVDVAPAGLAFEDWEDGDPLIYDTPPQGGAPYTPVRLRASGLHRANQGVTIRVDGVDPTDDAVFGSLDYPTRLVCANVGASAGTWVAADVHFRYFGWELFELAGRTVELSIEVEDQEGNVASTTVTGPLTLP